MTKTIKIFVIYIKSLNSHNPHQMHHNIVHHDTFLRVCQIFLLRDPSKRLCNILVYNIHSSDLLPQTKYLRRAASTLFLRQSFLKFLITFIVRYYHFFTYIKNINSILI